VMSGTRNATNSCSVIGRITVNQMDDNNWQAPTLNNVLNYPFYDTDWLSWSPTYTGYSTPPTALLYYKISKNSIQINLNKMNLSGNVSNSTSFSMTLPFLSNAKITNSFNSNLIVDAGVFTSSPGWTNVILNSNSMLAYKATFGTDNFTASGVKAVLGYFTYLVF